MMAALANLAAAGRPADQPATMPWPPRILVLEATPNDRAAIARVAARHGAADHLVYAPLLSAAESAGLVAGARGVLLPAVSEASGLAAIDAVAAGVPVIASSVGALPEIVGTAGILVEPRDRERLAAAIATAWGDAPVRRAIARAATERASGRDRAVRTWIDVANDVRAIYARVGKPRS
jgi:glycosyltransferase involved in cell wall biosynthesis